MQQSSEFDVVILGGGPAGCATALALQRLNVSNVLVVEAGHYRKERVGEGIPPDTVRLFQRLGIRDEFLAEEHDPCPGSCSAWGTAELGYNDFLFNPLGNGWHLERKRFDAFLADCAQKRGVQLKTGCRFDTCQTNETGHRLQLLNDDGSKLIVTTRFVVDATGQRAVFARRQRSVQQILDQLICVYGFFDTNTSKQTSRLTMLEACEYGWWYAARLPNERIAVAVAGDAEFIRAAQVNHEQSWHERLSATTHIAPFAAKCQFRPGSLLACPAPSYLLSRTAGNRWLAAGDAACALDPISAQGIYKSLMDGLNAAAAIVAFQSGNDEALTNYATEISERFNSYVELRNHFYGQEQRWSNSPFWSNRRDRSELLRDAQTT